MTKVFYLSEIVKFAIEREQQSYELYKKLHEMTDEAKAKELFSYLMEQELQHESFYEEMLQGVADEQTPNVHEDDEYNAYMDQLIATSRQIAPYQELDFGDLNAVLDYAMGREKDAILFYVGLKNMVPAKAKEKIDVIINEEGKHLVLLSKMRNS